MTELFIEKATIIHGDKYDYSNVNYKNNSTKIIIICKEHGEFEQTPNNHLYGYGCSKCAKNTKSNTKEFIEKATIIHINKYDYSKVDYKNSITKVIIICKEHGEFEQTPKLHLNGAGCGKCVGTAKSNTKEFIEKSIIIHGDKYDYSKVDYKKSITKVIIICKEHGEFEQTPKCHLIGHGCSKCGIILNRNKQRISIEDFIEKAKEKHGKLYDYSKVIYINNYTNIKIGCKKHGEFEQIARFHLKGAGCSKCAGTAKSNTKEFIEKATIIHGNKYDYSKVNYINNKAKVIIICKLHGEFQQIPNNILSGQGCIECGYVNSANKNRKTLEEFIKKSAKIHGDLYDYSKVDYINNYTKVIIICKKHGEFQQIASDHYNGHGCSKCYQSTLSERFLQTLEDFIKKSILVHGNKYDYSKVDYKYSNEKVIIICKIHGEFQQIPSDHYKGHGCSKCSGVAKLTTEEFIKRSKKIHGDLYDYYKVNYINNNTKVIIICKIHGEFYQNPKSHYMTGAGCPKCCNNIYSKMQILWLNFLSKFHNIHIQHALNEGEFVIPNTNFKADGYCKETNTIYEFHGDFWHGNPNIYKQDEINTKINCSFKELYEKTLIKENKIKELGYNLEIIWEKDWKKINKCIKIIQKKFLQNR
jgi:hypothetical protein